jgi:MoaA/NifB/PqqE/SkfB family radical SAM enzyme
MRSITGRLKEFAAKQAMKSVPRLLGNASDETLITLTKAFEKVAVIERDRSNIARMRWLIETGHPFAAWLRRVATELNPLCRNRFIENVYFNGTYLLKARQAEFARKHGFTPPDFMVLSVNSNCNLRCDGCWAGAYEGKRELEDPLLRRIIAEARDEMGVHFLVVTGGEPFLRKDLYKLYEDHPDCQFQIYTNALMIDKDVAKRLAKIGNTMPMLSLEGDEAMTDARRGKGTFAKVMSAMDVLRKNGVFFGFSVTATRHNADYLCGDEFIDLMVRMGCLYGWYFQYIPTGRNPDAGLMVTPLQRDNLRRAVYRHRNTRPVLVADFWNDGPEIGGCMAGGKRYLHINANGDVEPCVFAHFAVDNIRCKTLTQCLESPFFRAIREGIPYDGNALRACMITDRPEILRKYCREFGARPTHPGAEALMGRLAPQMDAYARGVAEIYDKAWREGDWMRLYPDSGRPAIISGPSHAVQGPAATEHNTLDDRPTGV